MGPGDGEVGQAGTLKLDFDVLFSLIYEENGMEAKAEIPVIYSCAFRCLFC